MLRLKGREEEGIFRLSVGTDEVAQMVLQIDSCNDYRLVRPDPHVAAVMMKRWGGAPVCALFLTRARGAQVPPRPAAPAVGDQRRLPR